MSDYRAIAGVSRTLKALLRDRMQDPAVSVSFTPPDVTTPDDITGKWLNLYLYQVSENGYLKNQEIPGQGHPGAYGHPPLSLDLYYLLTAHSSTEMLAESDLEAQEILGDAMRVLHDYSTVTDQLPIRRSAVGTVGEPILDLHLQNEFEQIKITLQPMSLEDLSRIWTAMPEANFRCSVTYQVSVVQIESRLSRRIARPVKTRRIHMTMSQRPQIDMVYRTPSPTDAIYDMRVKLGQEITIEGQKFIASKTWVRLGGLEPVRVIPLSDNEIQIAVPDDEYPPDADHAMSRPIPEEQQLQPGPQTVEVLTERETEVVEGGLDKGEVVSDQRVLRSNQAVFMLVPEILTIDPITGTAEDTLLTVNGKRLYKEGLDSFVLVGDVAIEVRPPAQSATSVRVPLAVLSNAMPIPPPTGQPYPVRVLVNGAQSAEEITFTLTPSP